MALDIERVITYPTESDDWVKTVIIGGLLTLLSIFIIPAFFLYGYVLRTLRAGIHDDEPPVFDQWGAMLKEGFVAFVVLFVYQLIPLIVMLVSVGGSVIALASGTDAGAGLGILGLLGGIAVSGLLALIFGYIGLIGLANYAHTGSVGAAFDLDVIRDVGLDGAYAIPWLYGVAVLFGVAMVTGILGIIPIIGAIASVFVTFYGQVAAAWVWGKGFGDAMGIDPDGSTGGGSEAFGDDNDSFGESFDDSFGADDTTGDDSFGADDTTSDDSFGADDATDDDSRTP